MRCTGALQTSLRNLLDKVRDSLLSAPPNSDLISIGITTYVECS